MSQENVEVVRRSHEAFMARQFDLTVEFWDPEGEWAPARVGFFDVPHGQTGVAPNAIELHPVLRFTGAICTRLGDEP